MKRYLLFSYVNYEAQGGMNDLAFDFETLGELKEGIAEKGFTPNDEYGETYYHIYDIENKEYIPKDDNSIELEEVVPALKEHLGEPQ